MAPAAKGGPEVSVALDTGESEVREALVGPRTPRRSRSTTGEGELAEEAVEEEQGAALLGVGVAMVEEDRLPARAEQVAREEQGLPATEGILVPQGLVRPGAYGGPRGQQVVEPVE